MKRQRVNKQNNVYVEGTDLLENNELLLKPRLKEPTEKWMEAQILPGDSLQAISLRFHCTVAELKRINKIDKENEIFARSVVKVPITPHTVLLDTIPKVHTSGNSSPKHPLVQTKSTDAITNKIDLDEKLIVAAVNSTSFKIDEKSVNDIILGSEVKRNQYHDDDPLEGPSKDFHHMNLSSTTIISENEPLLMSGEFDDSIPQPRSLRRKPTVDLSCNGSDWDISWVCLFVCILALCFAIPLVYIFWIAEHWERFHNSSTSH